MTSAQPTFVFGAMRSGTTLFRLILDMHSQIANPGEADFLFDYLLRDPAHPTGFRYDIDGLRSERIFRDKNIDLPDDMDGSDLTHAMVQAMGEGRTGHLTLNIHRNAPLMAEIFPDAKIIHLLRDPRDVANSSIGMGWSGNSYVGVHHWIKTERGWDEAQIPENRVLTLSFESLMANIEEELTRVCAFIGTDFDPGMLDYHLVTSYGPPDPKISQQWKNKSTPRQIARIEGQLGDLLVAKGYAPAGDPVYPGVLERTALEFENRVKRWRFNIRRYGFALFAAHHATRLPGLGKIHARLSRRKETIDILHLK